MSLITRLAAAAGLAAVLAAPAFAQNTSTALNGQLNWGDVVANINVVARDDAKSAAAIATAAGNAVSGANITGSDNLALKCHNSWLLPSSRLNPAYSVERPTTSIK